MEGLIFGILRGIYWYTRHYKDDSMRCGGKKKQWKSAGKLVGRQSNREGRCTQTLMMQPKFGSYGWKNAYRNCI